MERTITTIDEVTIKAVRKAMRAAENFETILVKGWGQIRKIGGRYAVGPLPEDDDSDPYTDYSAWSYCHREKWVLDDIARDLKLS